MGLFAPETRIYDVTVPFGPNVPGWPTQPPARVEPHNRIAQGDAANVSLVTISSHAGTHVDALWHFIDDGAKLLEIPVERWLGPCHAAHIPDDVAQIDVAHLEAANIPVGTERLLLRTRNSRMWEGWDGVADVPFREDYVGVLPAAAKWLVQRGIRLVGIDSLSIGTYGQANVETHQTLLGNGVVVIELLDLREIAPGPYELICLPLKLAIGDGAPARVLLVQQG